MPKQAFVLLAEIALMGEPPAVRHIGDAGGRVLGKAALGGVQTDGAQIRQRRAAGDFFEAVMQRAAGDLQLPAQVQDRQRFPCRALQHALMAVFDNVLVAAAQSL
ncbi:hypothetical protein D9M71_784190 [compost metagenome]